MNIENFKPKNLFTKATVAVSMSKGYMPFADFSGFIKPNNEVVLFDYIELDLYYDNFDTIKIYGLTQDELADLKSKNIKFSKSKTQTTILEFDENFFTLEGKKHEKIRRYKNFYTKRCPITVSDKCENIQELKNFLQEWKSLRKDAHFQLHTGYDVNFFSRYYHKFKDILKTEFFYFDGKLVGFVVVEHIEKNLYNLLIRKANTLYQNLTLFIDYHVISRIFDETQNTLYMNMGLDGGEKGMRDYKNNSFHVNSTSFDLFDIRITNGGKGGK